MFDLREADLDRINSMTKYPSIPTYHELGEKGMLQPTCLSFEGTIEGTEKVDGTNSRVIVLPHEAGAPRRYLLGSRENLLYAEGDVIGDPAQGIVAATRATAARIADELGGSAAFMVFFFETYGGNVTAASKQYTGERRVDRRLLDAAVVEEWDEVLGWPAERIAAWRDGGGQAFHTTAALAGLAERLHLEQAPVLFEADAGALPTTLPETHRWLRDTLPATRAALDAGAGGRPEGIVVRTLDRGRIAKIRFEDYERTLKRLGGPARRELESPTR